MSGASPRSNPEKGAQRAYKGKGMKKTSDADALMEQGLQSACEQSKSCGLRKEMLLCLCMGLNCNNLFGCGKGISFQYLK